MNTSYLNALRTLANCKRPAQRHDFEIISIKYVMPVQRVMLDYGAVLAGEL